MLDKLLLASYWQSCCIFSMSSPENTPIKHELFYLLLTSSSTEPEFLKLLPLKETTTPTTLSLSSI